MGKKKNNMVNCGVVSVLVIVNLLFINFINFINFIKDMEFVVILVVWSDFEGKFFLGSFKWFGFYDVDDDDGWQIIECGWLVKKYKKIFIFNLV